MSDDTIGSNELFLSDDKIFYTIEGEGEFVLRKELCD